MILKINRALCLKINKNTPQIMHMDIKDSFLPQGIKNLILLNSFKILITTSSMEVQLREAEIGRLIFIAGSKLLANLKINLTRFLKTL